MDTKLETLQATIAHIRSAYRKADAARNTLANVKETESLPLVSLGAGLTFLCVGITQSSTVGVNLGAAFMFLSLLIAVPLLQMQRKAKKEFQALVANDAFVERDSNRAEFWNDLTAFLAKNYDFVLPTHVTKNLDHFRSPLDAEDLEFTHEVDGIEVTCKLQSLVPYFIVEASKKTPSTL